MGKKPSGKPNQRPEKQVDWKLVDDLLIAGCLGTEIAAHFDMHPDTFYRKVENQYSIGFTAYSQEKRSKGDSILRSVQFEKAVKGKDNTMLVWLGKNRLAQKDVLNDNQGSPNDVSLNFADAYIKAEAGRVEMMKKIKELEDQLNALKPKADPVVHGSNETI